MTVPNNLRYDPLDPINTADGIPVAGAAVTIQGPDGTFTGLERKYADKPATYGTGRYEVVSGHRVARQVAPGRATR